MFWWCLGCFGVVWGISRPPKKKFSALYVRRWFGGVLGRFGVFRGRRFQKKNIALYGDALGFGMVLGGLGCFNGPHDGYGNRSNSKTSLPRANR